MAKIKQFTWAQAVRDIVVEAIRKGQILALAIGGALLLFLWRLPDQSLLVVWQDIRDAANRNWLLSVAVNVMLVGGWFMHSRRLRRTFEVEFERISSERNQLQKQLGVGVRSSEG